MKDGGNTSQPLAKNDWQKGMQSPNPKGRLPRAVEREYLDVFFGVVTTAKWGEVVEVALDDAINGGVTARRHGREWLSRIIVPALERILIASLSVNVSAELDSNQVSELIGMLTGNVDTGDLVDVIEGEVSE